MESRITIFNTTPNGRSTLTIWRLFAVVLLLVSAQLALTLARAPVAHAAGANPIVLENQQPGTTSWQFDNYNKASNHEIEGYASLTSVDVGRQISFMVSLSATAQYTMDIYRMGYYFHGTNPDGSACTGCGGRLMMSVGPLTGSKQAACPTTTSGADLYMIECQWTPSYTLTVPTTWTTGNYLVKLKRLDDGLENYMTFVVRDDADTADIVYSMDVTTWQAYSYWGGAGNSDVGYNLYGKFNDVTQGFLGNARAYTVSFDRPYMDQGSEDGAGNFMVWDYPMIHWMEEQGYNITYVTDVDLEDNPNLLNGHKVFVNTGHDEYVSDNERANILNFITAGGNAAFFSADDISRRMTWASSISGQPDRREHCDKGGLSGSTTIDWRYLTPPQPENQITGSLSNGSAAAEPFLVNDASSWVFAGTGLVNYNGKVITSGPGQDAIAGLIGYEFSTDPINDPTLASFVSYEPPGVDQVGHSFVPASDNGVNSWADSTLYTSAGGGLVFSAGTIEWSWGVDPGFNDGFCDCNIGFANTDSQIITANILNRMVSGAIPIVKLSANSLTFATQNVGTTSAAQPVTLTNTGSAPLTISSVALSGTNGGDFAQSNTCPISPSTLAATASCSISVTFTPTANGTRSASVTLTDNANDSPQSIALSGVGFTPTPGVGLSPTSLTFATQNVGTTSAAQPVTLTNTGSAPLTITSVGTAGANAGDFAETTTCPLSPSTLAVNANCAISVTFTPTANGTRNASVSVSDNATGSPQSVALSGVGFTPAPAVSLSPTSLAFGNQNVGTTSAAQAVTLTNSGTAALSVMSIGLAGANGGDFAQSNTCPISPSTLAAGATCTISVTFTPTANGARSASVSLSDTAAGSPQSVALTGTGVTPAPVVGLSPTSLTFGAENIGVSSAAQSVTLTNTGTAPLSLSSVAVTGANAGDFADTTTCPLSPSTLAVNANCTISVTFTPTANGTRSASVTLTDNAANSPQAIALSGTGGVPAPAVSLSTSSLSFGSQNIGVTSAGDSFTVTNVGTAALTISSVAVTGANAGDFADTTTCPLSPSTLAVNATCGVTITFTPSANGTRSASVNVNDNAADSPQNVALSGVGVTPTTGMSLIASANANGNFGGGVKVQLPTTVQAGDLLLAVAGYNGAPATWTPPTGWTAGANTGHPDGQGLNWWWKVATSADAGATITLKASSYADGGAVALDYRGATSTPIEAVSALTTNDNGGNGIVTSATFGAASWSGSASVVSLLLMSWQPISTTVTWPSGYSQQATATDTYGFVMVGANLTTQTASSLAAQTASLSASEAVVPTLQVAVVV